MKTAVSTVFVGKKRDYNRRFQKMCTHHLVEPVACTPGAGWEKGQVERQVGDVRGRLFVPSPRGRSYAEINEWLMDRCIEDARKHPHPTIPGKTVWQVFEEERPFLTAYRGPFDGFHATDIRRALPRRPSLGAMPLDPRWFQYRARSRSWTIFCGGLPRPRPSGSGACRGRRWTRQRRD